MNPRTAILALAATLAGLAGCIGTGGSPSGGLNDDLAATRAEFIIVDLATGTTTTAASAPASVGGQSMVFRRIPRGTAQLGAPAGEAARQGDEGQHSSDLPAYYLAVSECSQAQWTALAGTAPWTGQGFGTGATLPAYGLSYTAAQAALAAANQRMAHGRLALPSAAQWEHACRGGASTAYSWGSATMPAGLAGLAVVAESRSGDGPQPVAGRRANAYGLHDMHGNVWEFTADGDLRGGSWLDPVSLARAANRQEIEPDTALPIAGLRLCFVPGG